MRISTPLRQVVLATETTGLEPSQGHRVIEIGAVEIINRQQTGGVFHVYLNPEREIDLQAQAKHGLTPEFLADKPRFAEVAREFLDFIRGAELLIHNAPYAVGFLNAEMLRVDLPSVHELSSIVDILGLAKRLHPGKKTNLNALCQLYGVNTSGRQYHGALLDAQLLADVYLAMTGGEEPKDLDLGSQAIPEIGEQMADSTTPPPRTRRILVPDIAWVEIPAGQFVYQQGERRKLPTFWIAKYPITNMQYQCFIDDGGYTEERWWHDIKRPEPAETRWKQLNRPRTDVDWFEAVAFSRWLCARLGVREGGIRLPTEEEWERAARGPEGLAYPWGAEYRSGHANVDEKNAKAGPWYLAQTTAVGVYPHGHSPEGVEDLAGTVLEWCLNKEEHPEKTQVDVSEDRRVLRGGSWIYYPGHARAGDRGRDRPDYRFNYVGFRLLSSVPISTAVR